MRRMRTAERRPVAAPHEVAFLVAVMGGLVARYRRLREDPEHGGISIETAIIVAALIAAGIGIAAAIGLLVTKYKDKMDAGNP